MVAGISGGPDSMCLLYILHRLKINTIAVHCNYGLRGEDSDKDQELVEEMCSIWGLDCISVRLEGQEIGKKNFQAWARERRYQVFNDILEDNSYDYIVTAHHRDDQIETILQKILRGSGFSAWKGMLVLDGNLFRPMLPVSKSEIMLFLHDFHVPYRIDSTNEESTYARNFIRNHWFPDLNELFPGWKENLLDIPKRAQEFECMCRFISRQMLTKSGAINRKEFLRLEELLQPVILHFILKEKFPDDQPGKKFLENLSGLKLMQTGSSINVTENLSLFRDRDYFVFQKKNAKTNLSFQITEQDARKGIDVAGYRFEIDDIPDQFKLSSLYVDLSSFQFPILIRKWVNGDTIRPLGMDGTQLISDHLTNRKIPSNLKRYAHVVETFDRKICAIIFPDGSGADMLGTISEENKCKTTTRKTLIISKSEK